MNKILPLIVGVGIQALTCAMAAESPHFEYTGAAGPSNWAKLSPAYGLCASGKSQSPVNVAAAHDADLPNLDIKYASTVESFVNNGHAVQANYAAGSTLSDRYHSAAPYKTTVIHAPGSTIGHLGATFELKQLHFHSPSEHQRDGKNLPAEIHFVHADSAGNLAVIGVFVEEGKAHPTIATLWQKIPGKEGTSNKIDAKISAKDLLPAKVDYDFYQGSLTTPPCSEGVRWLVMKESITMSAEQLAVLRKAIGFDNNRPVQPLNGRVIFR